MSYPHHLELFIRRYLSCQGAAVDRPSYAVLEAIVDERLAAEVGSEHWKLAFDYDAIQEQPDTQYVTYGSAFLDKLVGYAVKQHSSSLRFCPSRGSAPDSLPKEIAAHLRVKPEHIRVSGLKCYSAPCLRFKFKLAYLSDDREEHLCHIWIDGRSGLEMQAYGNLAHIFYDDTVTELRPELPHQPTARLLASALTALDSRTAARRSELGAQNYSLHQADIERINSYFGRMITEYELKLAKAKFDKDQQQEEQLRDKLASINLQKQHHLADIKKKYSVRCEVYLLDAVLYMVPRWRADVLVEGRGSHPPTECTLWWDELLRCLQS